MRRYHPWSPHNNLEFPPNKEEDSIKTSKIIEPENGFKFSLQTAAGVLSYKAVEDANYTEFLRVAVEMMLAFNSSEIDPLFSKNIKNSLAAFDAGEDSELYASSALNEGLETDDDDDDINFYHRAITNAEKENRKIKEAEEYLTSLPKTEKSILKILQFSNFNSTTVEKLIAANTDLPPNIIHDICHKHMPFTLPFEKATQLYIKLRTVGAYLSIEPAPDSKRVATKTANAAKTTIKNKSKKSSKSKSINKDTSKKKDKIAEITGNEKITSNIGIINV